MFFFNFTSTLETKFKHNFFYLWFDKFNFEWLNQHGETIVPIFTGHQQYLDIKVNKQPKTLILLIEASFKCFHSFQSIIEHNRSFPIRRLNLQETLV